MSLLLPLGLAALITLPIVVLLHMRHTTPTPRPVPTLRFWLAAEPEQTAQTRLRRPPLTLLLLLHLAIAALLALALARPVTTRAWTALGLDLRTEPQHLILLLDGSTSMAATDTPAGATRFDEARDLAVGRLESLREGDVATVLLLGTRTSSFGATDAAGLGLLRERVAGVRPPGGRADLDAALGLTQDLLLPNLDDRVLVLSDGALAADPGRTAELGAPIELATVGGTGDGPAGNVAVVDVAARATPSNPDLLELYARVVNFSPTEVAVPVALVGGGLEIGRQTVTLPPNGGSAQLSWPLPPEVTEATVRVESDDALTADDEATLTLRPEDEADLSLRVLLVSDAPSALQRGLASLEGAEVTTESSANLAAATAGADFDLIVFEQSAPAPEAAGRVVAPNAPLLVVNPPPGGAFETDGAMLEPTVGRLRAQDPLLAGVDLAGVTFGETPVYVLGGGQSEVVGAEEGPLIFRAEVGEQPAIVFAFDVSASNLPRRVAFPILIANAVQELAPSPLPAAVPLGDPLRYRPRVEAATVRVSPPAADAPAIDLPLAVGGGGAAEPAAGEDVSGAPGAERLREVIFADTGQPGVYRVAELDGTGAEIGGGRFWVNAGHPRESDLRPNAELAAALAGAQAGAVDATDRASLPDLWPLLAGLGLVLLGVEWLATLLPRRRDMGWGTRSMRPAAGERR